MQNHVFGIVVSYLQRRLVIRVHLDYGIWYLIMEFNNFIHFLGYTKSPGWENKPLLLVPVQLHLTTYTAMLPVGGAYSALCQCICSSFEVCFDLQPQRSRAVAKAALRQENTPSCRDEDEEDETTLMLWLDWRVWIFEIKPSSSYCLNELLLWAAGANNVSTVRLPMQISHALLLSDTISASLHYHCLGQSSSAHIHTYIWNTQSSIL